MKTPMLLVSGWAHTAGILQPLVNRLARQRPVRVLALHELGDGSVRPGFSCYAAGLLRRLKKEKAPCILAGWSMGGMIALEAAAAAGPISALVMISSAPRLAAGPDFPAGVPLRILQSMRLSLRRAPERMLLDFFHTAGFPETPENIAWSTFVKDALAIGPDVLAAQLEYLINADLREVCRDLALPRLILHGTEDRIIPIGAAEWMKKHSPGACFMDWPHAGHRLPIDHPDLVADHVNRFLGGVE